MAVGGGGDGGSNMPPPLTSRPEVPTKLHGRDIINYVIKLVGVDFLILKVKFFDKYIY